MSSEAARLLHLAEQDPPACVETCRGILADSNAGRLHGHAHRALGIAYRELGQIDYALRELELARDRFREDGDSEYEAETLISLAAPVAISGRLPDAVAMLDPLLDHSSPSIRAHAMVQKASVIAHMGDLRGALVLYGDARPILDSLGDLRWLAILHGTRGMVESHLAEFEAAEQDFGVARDLYLELDQPAPVAEMAHNLGLVAVQRGDIARGLGLMLEAERLLLSAGVPTEPTLADRAYAYMLAGLPAEAFQVASRLARQLATQGRELERAEALYLAARAALASDDTAAAIGVADEAARVAADQGRPTWELLASVVREEAGFRVGLPGDLQTLVHLAADLFDQGMPSAATRALGLAALREIQAGDIDAAEKTLESVPTGDEIRIELPTQLILAVARATVALAKNERAMAADILEQAADLVDQHRAMLSATEARAGVSRLADEIARLGLEAMHEATPSVIEWTERFRGASLRIAPVMVSPDTDLAQALAELRPMMRDLVAPDLAGEDISELIVEARRLEQRVHDLAMARTADRETTTGTHGVDDIIDALSPRHMLYVYDIGGRTYGELVASEGIGRVDLGESERVGFLSGHLLSALRRGFIRGQTSTVVHEMISELAAMLIAPGVGAAADLVVVPPPELLGIPWTAMARSVDPNLTVTVAPSAGLWARADGLSLRHASLGVVAGPRLEFAVTEANRVGEVHADSPELLTGDSATVEAVLATMGSCDRLHAVAHTLLRDDNPMFSSLELADGFLNLYDLEGLESVPDTVVLSACDSAHDNVVGGHEMYGLTSVLLSRGARSVIATVAPIPDSAESVEAAVRIHTLLQGGATAAAAVRDAQSGFDDTVDPSIAFVAYGA
jgi:tetratricopeptide (TPR) repeat protein